MPDVEFSIVRAAADRYAAEPLIAFDLNVRQRDHGVAIRNVMLACQLRIEAVRRRYDASEQARLGEIFGPPDDWGRTLRSLLWTHVHVQVPAFETEASVRLPVPCSFDFNLGIAKYFYGLEQGEVPLLFLFSGSIFYEDAAGNLQIEQVSWSRDARYRLPLTVWRELMDHYYPDCTWLNVSRGTFDRICGYKRARGLLTFEQALEDLLDVRTGDAA